MLQSRVLEDPLVECYHRVGVIHFSCSAGWEHPRIVGVFGVLLLQQLHGILRDRHLADGISGFRLAQNEVPLCVPASLLTDGDGAVGFVEVAPLECDQLALSQSADQFQIEHRQGITPLGGIQIRADVVWVKDFHLLFFNFGDDAILRGIGENEFFLHRPVKGIVQHHMDAAHSEIAQSGFFLFLYLSQPAIAL